MPGTVQTFLKVLIGANTKGFRKDMDEGEKAVQKFSSVAKNALDRFAEVFGVDLDAARKQTKSFSDGVTVMGKGLKFSIEGTTGLTKALTILKIALISTGVGALVVALASLAVYFTKSEKGALGLGVAIAGIKARVNVLIERFAKYGEGVWDMLNGRFAEGYQKMSEAMYRLGKATGDAAREARQLKKDTAELAYAERNYNVWASEQNILLEDLRLKAKDLDLTKQERLAALTEAGAKEKLINQEGLKIAAEKILQAQTALSLDKDSKEKKDLLSAAYVNYNNLVAQSITFDRQLAREKNTLIKEIKAEADALLEAAKEPNKGLTKKAAFSSGEKLPGTTIPLKEIKTDVVEATSLMQQFGLVSVDVSKEVMAGFEDMSESLGVLLGELASGTGGLENFGQLAAAAFANMAITVGKICIQAGLATEKVKNALKFTGSGWAAVAAGIALVALGTAVKGAMANAASGSSSSGSFSGGSSGGGTYDVRSKTAVQQPIEIKINGKLRAEGKDLVYVFEQENIRKGIAT